MTVDFAATGLSRLEISVPKWSFVGEHIVKFIIRADKAKWYVICESQANPDQDGLGDDNTKPAVLSQWPSELWCGRPDRDDNPSTGVVIYLVWLMYARLERLMYVYLKACMMYVYTWEPLWDPV